MAQVTRCRVYTVDAYWRPASAAADEMVFLVVRNHRGGKKVSVMCTCHSEKKARRIAALLNKAHRP